MPSYMTIKKKYEVAPSTLVVSENSAFTSYVKKKPHDDARGEETKDKISSRREAFSYIRNLFKR